jgi:Flp pilus assembly protein TadG
MRFASAHHDTPRDPTAPDLTRASGRPGDRGAMAVQGLVADNPLARSRRRAGATASSRQQGYGGRVRDSEAHASPRSRESEAGQGLVELALVAPILVFLIMAIFQFAFVLETQMGLTNAVREAARRAAADVDPTTKANLATEADLLPQLDSLLASNIQGYSSSRLWTAGDGGAHDPSPQVTFCSYTVGTGGSATTNYRVIVYVAYKNPVFFPLLGYATDLADGVSNGTWDLVAQASMRLEGDGAPADLSGACP